MAKGAKRTGKLSFPCSLIANIFSFEDRFYRSRGEEKIVQNEQTEPTKWGYPKRYVDTARGEVCS